MVWFLLIFIVIDIIQTFYIRHLKKELAFRDREESNADEPVIRRKRKENRVIKLLKEVFWIWNKYVLSGDSTIKCIYPNFTYLKNININDILYVVLIDCSFNIFGITHLHHWEKSIFLIPLLFPYEIDVNYKDILSCFLNPSQTPYI